MHELNEIARTIPNMGFAIFGIYMAHSLYKTPRKIYQCVFAWLSVYAFWIAIGIPLDAIFLNNPAFPDVTHERICMFIVPAAVLVPMCGYGMALRIASGQMRIRRLEKRVGYDPLTGLKNRTYLLEDAGNMLKKGYDPVQVLFLDLDSFKSINDNFGHVAGDDFCAALHAEARKSWGATARCTASAGMNLSCCTTEMTWTGCAVSWKRDSGMKTVRIFATSA